MSEDEGVYYEDDVDYDLELRVQRLERIAKLNTINIRLLVATLFVVVISQSYITGGASDGSIEVPALLVLGAGAAWLSYWAMVRAGIWEWPTTK